MNRPWAIYEPCAGSAALTYWLCGTKGRGLMPYQGGKWRYRRELEAIVRELGFEGAPAAAFLDDAGPWSTTHWMLAKERAAVIDELRDLAELDPRMAYDSIIEEGTEPLGSVLYATRFLFLQRLAFSGKAVGDIDGRWVSPGFNKTSAYGMTAGSTKWKGGVKPQVPALIRVLKALPRIPLAALAPAPHHKPLLVYLDPTYAGTTKYPNGHMTREEVILAARGMATAHEAVMVSEAEPLEELVAEGWKKKWIGQRQGASLFKTTKEEWVTYTGGLNA